MLTSDPRTTGFAMRPSVALVMPWLFVVATWMIGLLMTVRFGPAGTPVRVITLNQLIGVTAVNAAILAALLADGIAVRGHPPCLRRPLLTGVLLGIVNVLLLQVGLIRAYAPLAGF